MSLLLRQYDARLRKLEKKKSKQDITDYVVINLNFSRCPNENDLHFLTKVPAKFFRKLL